MLRSVVFTVGVVLAQLPAVASAQSGTVSGQAFLTTRSGDVKKAAGAPVTLDLDSPTAKSWCARVCDDGGWRKNGDPTDSAFVASRRTTTADADGRFTFSDVPPGHYLIRTGVVWKVGLEIQGGMMAELVTVPASGKVDVVMSRTGNPYTRSK